DALAEVAHRDGLHVGPAGVTFDNLFATLTARAHLSGEPSIEPFTTATLPDVEVFDAGLTLWAEKLVDSGALPATMHPHAIDFVERVRAHIKDELASARDSEYVSSVLVADPTE